MNGSCVEIEKENELPNFEGSSLKGFESFGGARAGINVVKTDFFPIFKFRSSSKSWVYKMTSTLMYGRGSPSLLGLPRDARAHLVLGMGQTQGRQVGLTRGTSTSTASRLQLSSIRQGFACKASGQNQAGSAPDFNLSEYVEAKLVDIAMGKDLNIVYLKIGMDKVLRVYVGDFESTAMKKVKERKEVREVLLSNQNPNLLVRFSSKMCITASV